MSRNAMNELIKGEMVLKIQESKLQKIITKQKSKVIAEKKLLTKLMQEGDQELINAQAQNIVDLEANIRAHSKSKLQLHLFTRKIESARTSHELGASMLAVSKALGRVTQSMKLEQIEAIMTDLGKQYEEVDVMSLVMSDATATSTATTVSPEAVETLKRQVADAAGLELSQTLGDAVPTTIVKEGPTAERETDMTERLKALREHA